MRVDRLRRDAAFLVRGMLSLSLLLGLPLAARAERLAVKGFTTADGLARDGDSRIFQDPRGFLWFTTTEGLCRYDGYGFTTFGVQDGFPHPAISDIIEQPAGV